MPEHMLRHGKNGSVLKKGKKDETDFKGQTGNSNQ